ncbi:arabinan endo-1,5-alpha-L-arabinosidase [Lapidilactobacillus concavus DSM 17758]|uniref:Arabinan endo-1,5-alpha-L-arabinosidase n=1 Tax=Lapidilactobacillus concavus DSM 17758 TaxID=1423735 RepID=A0A0R1VS63_9LACO|nr:glycoside hydrolase family 43 protein [Lapidilactobacillus concavus]KRM08609.1 arabinan endo-1,5-alpha-L-arabinosidase [Lapidilactobacillus concavus DSM 17758]GEL13759.1 extracellular endo-alpha-(1->5)-L-arabinanase 2 [Lapidilactobacillus concavus]
MSSDEKKMKMLISAAGILLSVGLLAGCRKPKPKAVKQTLSDPKFTDVSVHDPSILKSGSEYYIFGSHMQMAKSSDLIKWQQISNNVNDQKLFTDIQTQLADAFTDANTNTFWAGDIEQLKDKKYYMYYTACEGDNPTAVIGLATADKVTGPYTDQGIFLRSGNAIKDENVSYDATTQPNAIDPQTFYDKNGQLWMVYGSYSGGIFILKMNQKTGLPMAGQGYGKRLLGGNHVRIEGSYLLYNSKTDYYYLFLSFGGLDATGGYNLRVGRSKNPDGPFVDSQGHDFTKIKGPVGTTFDDDAIEKYGVKIMGNHTWDTKKPFRSGYVSPGHNSAYYDAKSQKYFLIFHSRFPSTGEAYQDRVHQMFFTKSGWPVVAPLRYAGETIAKYQLDQVIGDYQVVQMNKKITAKITTLTTLTIKANGKISGKDQATLDFENNGNQSQLTIGHKKYLGYFLSEWNQLTKKQTMTFTGTDQNGEPVMMIRK